MGPGLNLDADEFDVVFGLILLLIKLDIKSAQDELDDMNAIFNFLKRTDGMWTMK